jgi:gliding motility-associated-like protein
MIRVSIYLLIFLFGLIELKAQPSIQWQKALGGSGEDYSQYIQQTSDRGYIVLGFSNSHNGDISFNNSSYNFSDYWIVKLDSLGTMQWQKCLGGGGNEEAYSVQQTSDGGYIIIGATVSNDGDVSGIYNGYNYWVVKLDSIGTIEWQKCLGGYLNDYGYDIRQTADGGYIVAGFTESTDGDVSGNHGNWDYWIVKLSSQGIIQWQKCFGGGGDDVPKAIQQTNDGGYIVAGYSSSPNGDITLSNGGYDYWIVKFSNIGNIQWQKSLGGTADDYAQSIQQTFDGGYIIAGYSNSNDGDVTGNHASYTPDYWVVKLSSTGSIQWQKTLGGTDNDYAYSIDQTSEGGYIVAGKAASNDGDITGSIAPEDYWIVKLSSLGTVQWQKSLGGSSMEGANCIQQTNDGAYIVTGNTSSNNGNVTGYHGGSSDYWVVKFGIPSTYQNINLCSGQTINVNSNVYSTTGTYRDTILNTYGIDSFIVITNLTLQIPITTNNLISICEGENITIGTNIYTQSGVYIDNLLSIYGCDSIITTELIVLPNPSIVLTASDTNVCSGDSVELTISDGLVYNWFPSIGLTFIEDSIVIAKPINSVTYFVTGIDSNGCQNADSIQIIITPLPNVSFSGLAPNYCVNGNISLLSGLPPNGLFSGGGVNGNIFNPTNSDIGFNNIMYTIMDTNGCYNSTSQTTHVSPMPVVSIEGSATICQGKTDTLIASGIGNFIWSTQDTIDTIIVNPTTTSTFFITASNYCGSILDSIRVIVNPLPTVTVNNDTSILLGNIANLNVTGGITYLWQPTSHLSCATCPNPESTAQQTTTYTVTVADVNGCSIEKTVTITVNDNFEIFVPDVFSPNADGENDILYVRGTGIKELQFVVYDRLGEKIFETTDASKGWDGTFKGTQLNNAVFAYYLSATLANDKKIITKGDITLIR